MSEFCSALAYSVLQYPGEMPDFTWGWRLGPLSGLCFLDETSPGHTMEHGSPYQNVKPSWIFAARDDGGGSGENRTLKTCKWCKAAVKSPPPAYLPTLGFTGLSDALPVIQSTVSKHRRR